MRVKKFRFIFKDGNFFAKRYMTLDELLDSNFALEQMEESINSESNIFDIEDYPDYEVFKDEYTGLKDKNLVEIYEGDIVYLSGCGIYECEYPFIELYEACCENDIGVIIGNIYENQDLLNNN